MDPKVIARIAGAVARAAKITGASEAYLWKLSRQESGLNPHARPPVDRKTGRRASSAYGLNQFIEATWVRAVQVYGLVGRPEARAQARRIAFDARGRPQIETETDRALLDLRGEPECSLEMAGRYAMENAAVLRPLLGRAPTGEELYLAHFRGAAGARQMLDPANANRLAADLAPSAAAANRTLFYAGARKLTVAEAARKIGQVYARQPGAPTEPVRAAVRQDLGSR